MIDPLPAHPFAWVAAPWGRALQSEPLARVAAHCFTTSDLPLGGPGADEGWMRLATTLGVSASHLMRPKQVHGITVVVIDRGQSAGEWRALSAASGRSVIRDGEGPPSPDAREDRPRADIAMTNVPGVAVAVQVADCVPLLLADPATGAVAAVHAGWRGTAARIAQHAVAALRSRFATRPADIVAAIGPSIGPCCYQVRGDVLEAFGAAGFPDEQLLEWFRPEDDHPRRVAGDEAAGPAGTTAARKACPPASADRRYRLDVPQANVDQLRAVGLERANITASGLCTACHPTLFPSYRRDGRGTGRLAGAIRTGAALPPG